MNLVKVLIIMSQIITISIYLMCTSIKCSAKSFSPEVEWLSDTKIEIFNTTQTNLSINNRRTLHLLTSWCAIFRWTHFHCRCLRFWRDLLGFWLHLTTGSSIYTYSGWFMLSWVSIYIFGAKNIYIYFTWYYIRISNKRFQCWTKFRYQEFREIQIILNFRISTQWLVLLSRKLLLSNPSRFLSFLTKTHFKFIHM